MVNNYALPAGTTLLYPAGYTFPEVSFDHSDLESDHLKTPTNTDITLPSKTVDGGRGGKPSVPSENFESKANSLFDEYEVKNDKLLFEGDLLMDDAWYPKKTPEPSAIPKSDLIGESVLYEDQQNIDLYKENKNCGSTGTILYTTDTNKYIPDNGSGISKKKCYLLIILIEL